MATVEKRGDSYRITAHAGYDIQGKQIKKRMTWKPAPTMTQRQVEKELDRQTVLFEERVRSGQLLDGSIRFSVFADYWLKEYAEKQLRPSTVARYKDILKRINEAIGNIKLEKLQPSHLMSFYNKLAEEGTRQDFIYKSDGALAALLKSQKLTYKSLADKCELSPRTVALAARGVNIAPITAQKISSAIGEPLDKLFSVVNKELTLSNKTILHHHRLISSILEKAVKWQVISLNPCKRVEPPKTVHKEAAYLDEVQVQELIKCLASEPLQYRTMILLLLYSGMRRGELCGLEWSDIDFENCLIDINKSSLYLAERGIFNDETKTQASKRVIKIPYEIIELLCEHRKEQLQTKLNICNQWVNSNKVFTQWDGKPIHPDTLTKWFSDFVKRNNLPPIHLHSLRHTNATLLIASGTDLRTVSKRLGHSNMTTTSNIYTHAIKSADERAAEMLSDILHPIKSRA